MTLSAGYIVTLVGGDYLSLLANPDSIALFKNTDSFRNNTPPCCVAHALTLFGNIFTSGPKKGKMELQLCKNKILHSQWLQILL